MPAVCSVSDWSGVSMSVAVHDRSITCTYKYSHLLLSCASVGCTAQLPLETEARPNHSG